MTKDEEHLKLLSIFHYVVAGVAALFGLMPVIYIVLGVAILCGKLDSAHPDPGEWVGGWFFVGIGSVFLAAALAFSVCVALAGRYLSRRQHYTFCVIMAGVACMFMPFGTILGVFTIIVLQRASVRRLFGREPLSPPVVTS